jgi:MFS family permease
MRNPASWPGFWLNVGLGGSFIAFAGLWAVPYLVDVHAVSKTVATYHTSAMLLGFAIGSWAIGGLSDRLKKRKPLLLIASALFTLCWIPWIAGITMPRALSLALFAVMGSSAGGFTLTWALVKAVNPHPLSGMATSLVNTGIFLGAAIYQPLIGWVLDRASGGQGSYSLQDYRYALTLLLCLSAAGVFGATYLTEKQL